MPTHGLPSFPSMCSVSGTQQRPSAYQSLLLKFLSAQPAHFPFPWWLSIFKWKFNAVISFFKKIYLFLHFKRLFGLQLFIWSEGLSTGEWMLSRVSSFLLLCGFWGPNSGCRFGGWWAGSSELKMWRACCHLSLPCLHSPCILSLGFLQADISLGRHSQGTAFEYTQLSV